MSPHMSNRLAAGRYELGEELDRGGMGTVFVAYDTYQNRRRVALKTILGTPESVHLELFQRELSVLGSLSHPNIVDVYDSGYLDEQGGTRKPFFVMPLLEGMTLDKRRQQMGGRGHFTVDESMNIIDQVARGLMAAHGRGIIHRDLKPSNIFVLPDLSVKIIDFGVAQLVGAISKSGQKGTLLYMAPEQIAENQSSALSDQFSLGAVFYEILVGRRAFERDNEKKVIGAKDFTITVDGDTVKYGRFKTGHIWIRRGTHSFLKHGIHFENNNQMREAVTAYMTNVKDDAITTLEELYDVVDYTPFIKCPACDGGGWDNKTTFSAISRKDNKTEVCCCVLLVVRFSLSLQFDEQVYV